MVTKKKERQNRKLLEGLPVVEVVIEPQDLDLTKYKRIGEEHTRTLEFEPGKLYVKEIIRPKYGLKDNTALPQEYQDGIVIADLHCCLFIRDFRVPVCWQKFSCKSMSITFHSTVRYGSSIT